MSDAGTLKARLRTELYGKRKSAHRLAAAHDPAAIRRLLACLGDQAGRIVAGYRPIRSELDPTEAMATLHEGGARIAVPVIEAAGAPLKFREWTPDCPMIEGAFGARVPESGAWLAPDILITPLVGWDRHGGRLGYGGGFYDRTLAGMRAARAVLAIGVAYAAQELGEAPREGTDETLDAIVTESETIILHPDCLARFSQRPA